MKLLIVRNAVPENQQQVAAASPHSHSRVYCGDVVNLTDDLFRDAVRGARAAAQTFCCRWDCLRMWWRDRFPRASTNVCSSWWRNQRSSHRAGFTTRSWRTPKTRAVDKNYMLTHTHTQLGQYDDFIVLRCFRISIFIDFIMTSNIVME